MNYFFYYFVQQISPVMSHVNAKGKSILKYLNMYIKTWHIDKMSTLIKFEQKK